MKSKKLPKQSVTKPMLKELADREKANLKAQKQITYVGSKPLDPPALYEDAGTGYNADFTFPQE